MNGNLFKIVLFSVIAVLLAIIGGVMSTDADPTSIGIIAAPFLLAGLYLMKEKVWYLWILLPPLFLILPSYADYGPLIAYIIVLPFFLWNMMIRRTVPTWNSIRLLDVVVFIIFAHVINIFITNPFGLGLNILQDYYGGKGYIMFLGALLAYLCLSTLKTTSNELGRILQWGLLLTLVCTVIFTVIILVKPETVVASQEVGSPSNEEDVTRQATFTYISSLILTILIINYSVLDMIKKPWTIILAGLACVGILVSGFRNLIVNIALIFFTVSVIYKRWILCISLPVLALGSLLILSSTGTLRELPFGIQRTLSFIPFLDVSPQAKADATASVEWRVEMWEWALDDREHFIQDKTFGDGFSRNINVIKADIYESAYNLSTNQANFAWNGQWHSGPISTIQTMGIVGLTLYIIMSTIGMVYAWLVCLIYRNHPYRLGILFIAVQYFISPPFFLFFFGDSIMISTEIISLALIKVLFCCAKREGLYISLHMRKAYMPLMIDHLKEDKTAAR